MHLRNEFVHIGRTVECIEGILARNMLPLVSELTKTKNPTKVMMSLKHFRFSYTFQPLVGVTA